ncbi:MAG: response regulator [Elusimicrobiota bacterium]
MSDKKVLIVDDDITLNKLMKEVIENEGYACISAFDGMDAVNKAKEEKPDIILLDMTLPMGRGEVVFAQLKQLIFTRNIPILIITSETLENLADFIVKKDIDEKDVFLKPVKFDAVKSRVNFYLSE